MQVHSMGYSKNFAAYQRWIRSTSARAKLLERMLDVCFMVNDTGCPTAGKHRDATQVRKSEPSWHTTF